MLSLAVVLINVFPELIDLIEALVYIVGCIIEFICFIFDSLRSIVYCFSNFFAICFSIVREFFAFI